ncbi:MAG TPA: SgcJ/EcaC family oxidoreductase [Sphingomicrobium sp.]
MLDAKTDEQAIREVVERWMAASKAGDTAAVLDLMTDDVLFMTPGQEPFGKGEFRARSQSLKGVEIDGHADTLEVEVLGDRAWIRSHLEMTMTPDGGEPVGRSGYTLTILKKGDDGRWRLFRDANLVS